MKKHFTKIVCLLIILLANFISQQKVMAQDVKIINIPINDVAYVPALDKLVIVTPSGQTNGNSICFVDPYFGKIEKCRFIGSEPNVMTVSDDSKYVYVGLLGATQIVRFNIEKDTIDQNIQLGAAQYSGGLYAEDIKVMPGHSNVIAVARRNLNFSPRHEGVVIFDNGVQRPLKTTEHTGSNSITFAKDSSILYGLNNETSEFGFRVMSITSEGIKIDTAYRSFFNYYGPVIEYADDRIYSNRGGIIDLASKTLIGSFNLGANLQNVPAALESAPDSNVVYIAIATNGPSSSNGITLKTFDKNTFNPISDYNIPNSYPDIKKLINWGKSGRLAFITSSTNFDNPKKQLVIIRSCNSLITSTLPSPIRTLGCLSFVEPITLIAPEGYNNYFWSNGATTRVATATMPGQYTYTVSDSLGCQSQPSPPVTLNYDSRPDARAIEAEGPTTICQGGTATLRVVYGSDSHTFLWSNGTTGSSINVTSAGAYSVRTVNLNGCPSEPSNVINVTVLPAQAPPKPVITVTGKMNPCLGDSITLSAPAGYAKYNWFNDSQTSSTIKVGYPGQFVVKVTNAAGCESVPSDPVQILFKQRPFQPTIIANGNTLVSTTVSGNQWFLNGVAIPGATGQFYQATTSGFYTVQVTDGECLSEMSDLYNFTITDVDDPAVSNAIKVFPNPVTDILHIVSNAIDASKQIIELRDITGSIILHQKELTTASIQLDISHLPAGMYVLQIRDEASRKRLLVQKITKL